MTSKLALVLLSLTLILSGCLGTSDGDDEALDPTNTSTQGNETSDVSSGTDNTAPEASLSANQTTGQAPLAVTFTLEGSDADGDALRWTFTIQQGAQLSTGDQLPATVNHTYDRAGNFTAVLTVDDGNQTAGANLTITVTAPDTDDATGNGTGNATTSADDLPDPVVINGTAAVGHPAHILHCFRGGIDGSYHEISPAEGGWTYALEPAEDFAVYWWGDGEFLEAGETSGTVPSEATHAEVCMTEGNVMGSYSLTLWAPGHPDAPS